MQKRLKKKIKRILKSNLILKVEQMFILDWNQK